MLATLASAFVIMFHLSHNRWAALIWGKKKKGALCQLERVDGCPNEPADF